MRRLVAFLSLFTSIGTLVCCALPALFVLLGFGAAFAGLVTNVPQLIWFSEHKMVLFLMGAVLLVGGGALQWRARRITNCVADPGQDQPCKTTREWSRPLFFVSVAIYLVGAFFAFFAERLV